MFTGLAYSVMGLIEALVGLRFILRLLGANPANAIVEWIYNWSGPLVAPFAGIFGQSTAVAGPGVVTTSVFDWTALVALIVYGVIAAFLARGAMGLDRRG